MSVRPSGVMTLPFGNRTSSAATLGVPSGATRMSTVGTGVAPPSRSNPKLPT